MDDFLTVDGLKMGLQEAIRRDILHDNEFVTRSIEALLIRKYAEENGIENTKDELQTAADEMRYLRGLESKAETMQWLENNHQTLASIENALDYQLLRNKVRNSFPEEELRAYFADHQPAFDRVELYSIRVDRRPVAEELYAQITEDGLSFYEAAVEYSEDEDTAPKGGYVGMLTRSDVTGKIEAAVFDADDGDIVGPMETDAGWNLFLVQQVQHPDFEAVESEVQFRVFEDLIATLKAEADIQYEVFEEDESA
jgi:parvulin-like peptidyl-prolyl isomerase